MKPLRIYYVETAYQEPAPLLGRHPMYAKDEADARIAELEAELAAALRGRVHVRIPTDTMEQEFATHYRRGFEAGRKQAEAERDAAHKRIAEIEGHNGNLRAAILNQAETIDQAWTERDAARADAERYRWLNNPNNGLAATYLLRYGLVQPQELDAAIDAARGME